MSALAARGSTASASEAFPLTKNVRLTGSMQWHLGVTADKGETTLANKGILRLKKTAVEQKYAKVAKKLDL